MIFIPLFYLNNLNEVIFNIKNKNNTVKLSVPINTKFGKNEINSYNFNIINLYEKIKLYNILNNINSIKKKFNDFAIENNTEVFSFENLKKEIIKIKLQNLYQNIEELLKELEKMERNINSNKTLNNNYKIFTLILIEKKKEELINEINKIKSLIKKLN